jgi:hypothetical protein
MFDDVMADARQAGTYSGGAEGSDELSQKLAQAVDTTCDEE